MENVLEIKQMESGYKDAVRIFVEKLEIKAGELTTLIGRNGSGKSTLLKTIVGMLRYTGGLRIDHEEASALGRGERARRVAYLPQLLPAANIDVQTLVEHGRYPWHGSLRRMGGHDRERVEEAIRQSGLEKLRDKNLAELSGGERQRAYLAMVIAQDAKLILLDEPAASLDISVQTEVYELLRELKAQGRGILVASHDLPLSFSASDSIALVEQGRVSEAIPPQKLCEHEGRLYEVMGVKLKGNSDEDALYAYYLSGAGSRRKKLLQP